MSADAIGGAILALVAVILVVVVAFRARQILADYGRPKPKSAQLPCCEESSWSPERDLDHAEGFEYVLGKCGHCGTPWMSVFCGASGISGYEPVTPTDVQAINSLRGAGERKEFMRGWAGRNL